MRSVAMVLALLFAPRLSSAMRALVDQSDADGSAGQAVVADSEIHSELEEYGDEKCCLTEVPKKKVFDSEVDCKVGIEVDFYSCYYKKWYEGSVTSCSAKKIGLKYSGSYTTTKGYPCVLSMGHPL